MRQFRVSEVQGLFDETMACWEPWVGRSTMSGAGATRCTFCDHSHQNRICATSLSPMSESPGSEPGDGQDLRPRRRALVVGLLRALASTVALVAVYYLLPLDKSSIGIVLLILTTGLVGLVALVTFQVRSIARSRFPVLRAVEALATSIPWFLLVFAGTYFILGRFYPGSFSEPLTRTDALYFTVTVFATVGFGDITATTELTRVVVMGQMVLGIVIVGLGARVVVDAVKRGQQRQPAETGEPPRNE
jgi:voltage-gated potassium channel